MTLARNDNTWHKVKRHTGINKDRSKTKQARKANRARRKSEEDMIVYLVLAESTGSGRFNWYYNFNDAVTDLLNDITAVKQFENEGFGIMLKPVQIDESVLTTRDMITDWIDVNIAGQLNLNPENDD